MVPEGSDELSKNDKLREFELSGTGSILFSQQKFCNGIALHSLKHEKMFSLK